MSYVFFFGLGGLFGLVAASWVFYWLGYGRARMRALQGLHWSRYMRLDFEGTHADIQDRLAEGPWSRKGRA